MVVLAFVVYLLAHAHPAVHWAAQTWAWMCHHVVVTIIILLFTL
jgi:hypothetical protein